MKNIVLVTFLFASLMEAPAQYQEPGGGLYPTNLVFFADDLSQGVSTGPWGVEQSIDASIRKNGNASWRWNVQTNGGSQILWGDWVRDTMVFWVHENSHVSFWVRPSNEKISIAATLGLYDGMYELLPPTEVGPAGEWRYMDILVPAGAIGRPLNDLRILIVEAGRGPATVHFDDIRISDVRLYAGRGTTASIHGIHADQIGYDTFGIKTFSSEPFNTFQIVRVIDNAIVYTGSNRRLVASRAVNDSAVWQGDFTEFRGAGRYVIRLDNGGTSYPFDIGPSVYDAPLRAAIRFFYYQRNNTAIEMPYAEGPWIHAKDSKEVVSLPGGGTKVVRRGWHDAGDLSVYMLNHTYASFWLALAWEEFRYNADDLNIPESGDGIPDLLNELRWGLDWIVDMQDTTDGAFYENMCVQGKSRYRYGGTTPLTISGYELTNKTTSATAAGVAMLAYGSVIFDKARLDPAFSARMKSAALQGWRYLQGHPVQTSVTTGCDNYHDPDDRHGRFFAATALFYLTGEKQYHDYILTKDPGSTWISDFHNRVNLGYLLYLKCPNADPRKKAELQSMLADRAKDATEDRMKHSFGFAGYYYWGSLGTAFARAGNYLIPDWKSRDNRNSIFTALQQLHYTFGQNSLGFCYLSGFGTKSMSGGFHHWLKSLRATPRNFPGMLAGGPNENPDVNDMKFPNGYSMPPGTAIDSRYSDGDSWSTNEVAVNQNAQLVYVLVAAHSFAHQNGTTGTIPSTKKAK